MTTYMGGCQRCEDKEGEFASLLPNGVCVDVRLAGGFFCDDCCEEMRNYPILIEKQIAKVA